MRECLLCVCNRQLSPLPLLPLSLCVFCVYCILSTRQGFISPQSNPIPFFKTSRNIFLAFIVCLSEARSPRTCAFAQVWRDLGRSQKWSTITAFVSPNYMEKPQICICLLRSPPSLAHVCTLAHMSWPQNKKEPRIRTSRLGEMLKRKTMDLPMCVTIFYFFFCSNSNYVLWGNKRDLFAVGLNLSACFAAT